MVTGIETAGLALAAFPLIIEGLKFYASGYKTIGELRNYQKVLNKLVRELKLENTKFENTINSLLEDMVPQEDVTEIVESPDGHRWRDADFRHALEKRLRPGVVEPYLEAIQDLHHNLAKLKTSFGLNMNSKAVS